MSLFSGTKNDVDSCGFRSVWQSPGGLFFKFSFETKGGQGSLHLSEQIPVRAVISFVNNQHLLFLLGETTTVFSSS